MWAWISIGIRKKSISWFQNTLRWASPDQVNFKGTLGFCLTAKTALLTPMGQVGNEGRKVILLIKKKRRLIYLTPMMISCNKELDNHKRETLR